MSRRRQNKKSSSRHGKKPVNRRRQFFKRIGAVFGVLIIASYVTVSVGRKAEPDSHTMTTPKTIHGKFPRPHSVLGG